MNAVPRRRVAVCAAGMGNVRSVVQALQRADAVDVEVTHDAGVLRRADAVVVPGQGAFGTFVNAIRGAVRDALLERLHADKPYLGICLGMQVLFASSEEAADATGLGWLEGTVRRLSPGIDPATGRARPLPHLGWNEAEPTGSSTQASARDHFYFAHSYAVAPVDASIVAATTTYGEATFPSIVARGAVLGVQFHPEKSQRAGLGLVERWLRSALP